MKLSKFYDLLYAYAKITLKQGRIVIYSGPVKEIPDEFDDLEVIDFKCTDRGFVFQLKKGGERHDTARDSL